MQKPFYLFCVLLFLAAYAHAQKAFDMVSYTGKIGQEPVQLDLADGYLMGSIIKLGTGKKAKRYLPEPADNGKLLFMPEKSDRPASSFEVAIADDVRPTSTIKVLFINGKQRIHLILKRINTKG